VLFQEADMKLRVKDHDNLVRDPNNMAILNRQKDLLTMHDMKMRELAEKEAQRNEINSLKSDVSDIKTLLQQIIQRLE
jgi:hypothetical protein